MRVRLALPTVLLLLVLAPWLHAQTTPQETVGGKVVDARTGQPLAHALVTLNGLNAARNVLSVFSGPEGRFQFTDPVKPGKYRLQARANGYLPSAYLQHGELSTAIVTGAGLATNSLVLALTPDANIAGRVVDENGDPVPHATVLLFRQNPGSGTTAIRLTRSTQVDDEGAYEFGPLVPGRYFVAARGFPWYAVHPPQEDTERRQMYRAAVDPSLDVAYPTVFYPNAQNQDAASPIEVAGGDQVTANLQLLPQHALTLTLRTPGGSNGAQPQLTETLFGSEQPLQTLVYMGPGTETIAGIPPGHYTVREYAGNGNRLPYAAGTVDLTTASVVRDAAGPPDLTSITVTVHSSDADPLPSQSLVTLSARAQGPSISSNVNNKGEAEFQRVPPGEYRLRIAGNRHPSLGIGSLTVNGQPVPDEHLHVTGAGHLDARVVLSGAPVTVAGFARRDGKSAPACLIVLVPAGANTDPELFRRDQSDLDGSFTLPAVVPGKYLLLAIQDGWSLPWTDLRVLMPYLLKAQPLVVPAGASGTLNLSEAVSPQPVR